MDSILWFTNRNIINNVLSQSSDYDITRRQLTFFSNSIAISVSGSPADKSDLEIGDEILEVNGKTFKDNCNHNEVITHIHDVSIIMFVILTPVTALPDWFRN